MTAVLLCHEISHVLEFRCIREAKCMASGLPFPSSPGATCTEVGSAWELRVFGGTIWPICHDPGNLSIILEIAVRSQSWNSYYMAITMDWISLLFTETFWSSSPQRLRVPFVPIMPESTRCGPIDNDELEDEEEDGSSVSFSPSSRSPTKRRRGERGEIKIGSPRKWSKDQEKARANRALEQRRCGGKRVRST